MENETTSSEVRLPGLAIGLIGAGTLLLEILLTRIFSVTMWYHFAFVAISLALFGIAASGAMVTAAPRLFTRARVLDQMAAASWWMAVTVMLSFLVDLHLPFIPFDAEGYTYLPLLLFAVKFLVLSLPFFFSGLVIALAFTHAPRQVHRTYFADLAGGGMGCFLVVPVLSFLSGPTAVIASAAAPLMAAALFHRAGGRRVQGRAAWGAVALVLAAVGINAHTNALRITKVKSYQRDVGQIVEGPIEFERWHPVSRVAVHPLEEKFTYLSWFYSSAALEANHVPVPGLMEVTNDGGARTYLFPKSWGPGSTDLFRYDLTDIAYAALEAPEVLVVGVGGGKDILSALALGASRVTGVELNPVMIDIVQDEFAEFTGAPYDDPRVDIVIGEGRHCIASSARQYDLIKMSVTDTWAASTMGAYALTENYLYTVESIRSFVAHLKPGGYLSIVRWYPHESIRLAFLAATALEAEHPELQIAMARSERTANILIKRGVFAPDELERLRRRTESAGLVWIGGGEAFSAFVGDRVSPEQQQDEWHRVAATRPDLNAFSSQVPFSVAPPTDDRPFFFSPVSIAEAGEGAHNVYSSFTFQHGRALNLLWGMLQISLVVSAVFVIGPLLVRGRRHLTGDLASNVYFMMLGFGYLLVEIPILQRFILFLGHPTYAVTLVLLVLLISSGVGSLLVERVSSRAVNLLFPALLAVLLVLTLTLPALLERLIGLGLAVRVVVSVVVICPLGLLLGMPFPVGLRELHRIAPDRVPWCWAINGAASVGAPVVAMILSITSGSSRALYTGAACYLVAAIILPVLRRQPSRGTR